MMAKIFRALVLFLSVLALSRTPSFAAERLDSGIIRVYSYVQRPDFDAPWAAKQSERLTHMGLVVGKNQVLVSAYAVRSAKHYEAERIGESRRYPLRVKAVDSVVNLALLEFSEATPEGLEPLSLGDDLELGANVTIYQAVDGESLVARTLRLREVQMQPGVLTSYQLPDKW